MLFRPLHTCRHEDLREALLVDIDSILDDGEVDVGYLKDVVGKVAFEDALPMAVLVK